MCRPNEAGPAVIVEVHGLRDRRGLLRLELYPAAESDFLADDAVLVEAGKTFRRLDFEIPGDGVPKLCLRAPGAGTYTLALLHDRNGDHKFNPFSDGAGFPGNPALGLSRPRADKARVEIGAGPAVLSIRMNYWRGLSFGPLQRAD